MDITKPLATSATASISSAEVASPEICNSSLTTGRPSLSVATYNVYYKGYDREETLQAIAKMPADVILMQETNEDWEKAIREYEAITSKYKHIKYLHDKWSVE